MNVTKKPIVAEVENQKVVYEKKTWLIFSWYEKAKTESIGKDLYIESEQAYDNIFLNGKELNK